MIMDAVEEEVQMEAFIESLCGCVGKRQVLSLKRSGRMIEGMFGGKGCSRSACRIFVTFDGEGEAYPIVAMAEYRLIEKTYMYTEEEGWIAL